MGDRCTVHFENEKDNPEAIVYAHWGGSEMSDLLHDFFDAVEEQTKDHRYNDPVYLAAKFVVWLAGKHQRGDQPLNFLSVGVTMKDPGDIYVRYHVLCRNSDRPHVTHEPVQ